MDSHTLEVLGFPRIRELLAGFCQTPLGASCAQALIPGTERDVVLAELDRTDEALRSDAEPELRGAVDITRLLERAVRGAVLEGQELRRVAATSAAVARARAFAAGRAETMPLTAVLLGRLPDVAGLVRSIERSIDEHGEVRDDATTELNRIRREARRLRNRLVDRLEQMAADNPDWFGDRPTVRRERFVLPVRIDARERIAGVVHESSGSGQTLFIEPMETVSEQNRLAELRGEETGEVARVLRGLTEQVSEAASELRSGLELLAEADLLFARVRLARRFRCVRPEIAGDGRFRLVGGRHPLLALAQEQVVPLDFELPDGVRVVLISGPNAGGKTVVLKTVGLLCLMLSAGLFVPAYEGTRLPLCSRVLADIGDEQSLEGNLSSFTAHLRRLREFLESADQGSLVLLDEIGASTAPEEGTALAISVLEELRDSGVTAIATSHFGGLKLLVQESDGMANGAMGFSHGLPTYRLNLGIPGESSAFDTAARVGLPSRILARARQRMGPGWLDLSERLQALNEEFEQSRAARRAAVEDERQARRMRTVYEEKLKQLRQQEAEARERVRSEREVLLRRTRREIENLVRNIREGQAERDDIVRAKRYVEQELEQTTSAAPPEPEDAAIELEPGDVVESRLFRRQGEIVEITGEQATVAFGNVRVQVRLGDLTRLRADTRRDSEPTAVDSPEYRFEPRLNLRGMRAEEADLAVQGFIDEASACGATELEIVHGKGTGALQSLVWQSLRCDRRIESFQFAAQRDGGSGVTLVRLRATA